MTLRRNLRMPSVGPELAELSQLIGRPKSTRSRLSRCSKVDVKPPAVEDLLRKHPAASIRYYWEDFTPGWSHESGTASISAADIKRFAQEYDPQSYHTDETAAKATPFGGLIASGWHTCAVAMRLMCDSYLLESSCIGSPGLEELRWLKPVRPDDRLRLRATVLEQTPSRTQPSRGTVKFRWDVLNQNDDVACTMIGRQHYLRRVPAP
jgi:acyl dehydratase